MAFDTREERLKKLPPFADYDFSQEELEAIKVLRKWNITFTKPKDLREFKSRLNTIKAAYDGAALDANRLAYIYNALAAKAAEFEKES